MHMRMDARLGGIDRGQRGALNEAQAQSCDGTVVIGRERR